MGMCASCDSTYERDDISSGEETSVTFISASSERERERERERHGRRHDRDYSSERRHHRGHARRRLSSRSASSDSSRRRRPHHRNRRHHRDSYANSHREQQKTGLGKSAAVTENGSKKTAHPTILVAKFGPCV
nr:splicing factor U2af large subunit A-like [Penaeus vannamei]